MESISYTLQKFAMHEYTLIFINYKHSFIKSVPMTTDSTHLICQFSCYTQWREQTTLRCENFYQKRRTNFRTNIAKCQSATETTDVKISITILEVVSYYHSILLTYRDTWTHLPPGPPFNNKASAITAIVIEQYTIWFCEWFNQTRCDWQNVNKMSTVKFFLFANWHIT